MEFPQPLIEGRLLKRYKRFLADVELKKGEVITAHTANTGAMTGCSEPGSRVWLSISDNPKRKYPHSWEIVEVAPKVLCGINTLLGNHLVNEAIVADRVPELKGYAHIRREVPYGEERSRIDLLLEPSGSAPPCYVEVKNVTLADNGVALFPDAVTVRGTKHLRELTHVVEQGARAVIFYCVQRNDCREFRPAETIDAVYAQTLREAMEKGVEAIAYQADVSVTGIRLTKVMPVCV
ncbi:MAG: DNA/RNA nuclease SfsA [Gammaproteobacteria bacterium]|nr:DNA/RNA nuclease SfsA [Gammaproteobacteria bacterium]MCF6259082.1 DNA/RNA nuclease SfsA [Gammaproteobacteria bacterium]